jgi:hypothetical protein
MDTDIERLQQIVNEDKYSKHNIRSKIIKDISNIGSKIAKATRLVDKYRSRKYYESKNIRIRMITMTSDQIVIEIILLTLVLTVSVKIQVIVGKVANQLDGEPFDRIKTAAELIAVVCQSDLYDISNDPILMIHNKYKLEPETINYIELTKYLPPMVCSPNVITNNSQDSYLTRVKSVLLGKGGYHNRKLGLDVINIASSVCLELDQNIIAIDEQPSKKVDTPDKLAAFKQFKQVSIQTYKGLPDENVH